MKISEPQWTRIAPCVCRHRTQSRPSRPSLVNDLRPDRQWHPLDPFIPWAQTHGVTVPERGPVAWRDGLQVLATGGRAARHLGRRDGVDHRCWHELERPRADRSRPLVYRHGSVIRGRARSGGGRVREKKRKQPTQQLGGAQREPAQMQEPHLTMRWDVPGQGGIWRRQDPSWSR